MNHPFTFRPGTYDEDIFRAVVVGNEYKIPDRFETEDIILDIGAHIGSFSYACVLRGSCNVHTFEAFRENFECASRNLAPVGSRSKIYNCAVWRSDRKEETLYFNTLRVDNTGAGHVLGGSGTPIQAMSLDKILSHVTDRGRRRVRLMKIDCEGSEFPILLTSQRLHLVDAIVGEYHNFTEEHKPEHPFHHIPENARVVGYDRFTIEVLLERLRQEGFRTDSDPHPDIPTKSGWFRAERPWRPEKPSIFRRIARKAKRTLMSVGSAA